MAKRTESKRKCGVLLPVSSLPSDYGIGTFSKEAYEFIDFLARAGQTYWQILPLGPTSYGDSPYQSFSTFAGNPYFIDPEEMIRAGWISHKDMKSCDFGDNSEYVDYEKMYQARFGLLKKAYEKSGMSHKGATGADPALAKDFGTFCTENAAWLDDYALYMTLKNIYSGLGWNEWPGEIRMRNQRTIEKLQMQYADETGFYRFQQYLFDRQWKALKAYANAKGIRIIGDIPIYVAFDSADTWANPELFQLDEENVPIAVAGCPPDAFSATGQLWGNPLYRWDYHKKTDFAWWMKRIHHCFDLYDVVRIDHFRGFDEYYSIPYGNPTAEHGEWKKGPGYELFRTLKEQLGDRRVIAEDLGFLTPSVIRLVKKTGYPGMKILQFAFDSREESDYLPHNYDHNCVVYTGTHDNDTMRGWYKTTNAKDRNFAKRYLNIHTTRDIAWEFIRSALSSVANTAIIPMQDYLDLGSEARINTPSTLGNNWKWRMKRDACTDALAKRMYDFAKLYGRL